MVVTDVNKIADGNHITWPVQVKLIPPRQDLCWPYSNLINSLISLFCFLLFNSHPPSFLLYAPTHSSSPSQTTRTSTRGRSTGSSTTRSWRWNLDTQNPSCVTGWAAISLTWSAPAARVTVVTASCPLMTWTSWWPSTTSQQQSTPLPWWSPAFCRFASWCWCTRSFSLKTKECSRTPWRSTTTNTLFRSGYDSQRSSEEVKLHGLKGVKPLLCCLLAHFG